MDEDFFEIQAEFENDNIIWGDDYNWQEVEYESPQEKKEVIRWEDIPF